MFHHRSPYGQPHFASPGGAVAGFWMFDHDIVAPIWWRWCPEIGLPQIIQNYSGIFPEIKHPAIRGMPILGNHPVIDYMKEC